MITLRLEGLTTLRKKMEFLAKLTGKTLDEEVTTQARGFVREMAKITPPAMGSTTGAQARGEAAVYRDIRRVYLSPGLAFDEIERRFGRDSARAFWSSYKQGAADDVHNWMQRLGGKFATARLQGFDGGSDHSSLRNNRGRVTRAQWRVLASDDREVQRYIDKRRRNVGLLASGWNAAARLVNDSRPRYASRHGDGNGSARRESGRGHHIYVFKNAIDYATQQDLDRRSRWVLMRQRKKLVTRIRYAVRHAARQASSRAA